MVDNAEADAACRNAEKSLCTADEWQAACVGPEEAPTAYGYGDEYEPTTCCDCGKVIVLGEESHSTRGDDYWCDRCTAKLMREGR